MDELAYRDLTDGDIENLSDAELIDIIENIWGFEETSEALRHLAKRDPQKSLELGKDILQNNKGDDYLQGIVWILILGISPMEVIDSLSGRKEAFEKVLLRDILVELNSEYYLKDLTQLPDEFVAKVIHSYDILDVDGVWSEDMCKELEENFDEFIKMIKC